MRLYRLLIMLLYPALCLYSFRLAWRFQSLKYLKQRLGFSYPQQSTKPIWLHCASVGEFNTALPLIDLLQKNDSNQHFIISSNTVTGEQTFLKQNLKNCQHVFLPLDSNFAVKRFLNTIQPSLALILETELWPQLYRHCGQKNIPVCLINARLSAKTLKTNKWIKGLYRQSLKHVEAVLARSENDRQAFIQLGAKPEVSQTIGNLKFSSASQKNIKDVDIELPSFILLASSHHDEENQLALLWQQENFKHLLVIVPRHPERGEKIQQSLNQLSINTARRSTAEKVNPETQIYIADTLGELNSFMLSADIVIMGGSFIKRGGQNLLEPARLGKAIIVGPHMFNFSDEIDLFLQHKACLQAASIGDLKIKLNMLLTNPQIKTELQNNALDLMKQSENISEKYIEQLQILFPELILTKK